MPRRCAFGCPPDKTITTHKFPHPIKNPVVFKTWVKLVGGRLRSPADYKCYADMVICDVHFTFKDKNRNNRLNAMAVPSLYIAGELAQVSLPIRTRRKFLRHHLVRSSNNSDSDHSLNSDASSNDIKPYSDHCSDLTNCKLLTVFTFLIFLTVTMNLW